MTLNRSLACSAAFASMARQVLHAGWIAGLIAGMIAGTGCHSVAGAQQHEVQGEASPERTENGRNDGTRFDDSPHQSTRSREGLPVDAQRRVDRLASAEFAGRGYLRDGHNLAADFIAGEFRTIGLLPIGGSYFRTFELDADLFPTTPTLQIDGRELEIGIDFLPFPGSASASLHDRKLIDLNHGLYLQDGQLSDYAIDVTNSVVMVREGLPDSLVSAGRNEIASTEYKAFVAASKGAVGMVVVSDNLVYGLSHADAPIPVVEVAASSIPDNASVVSLELDSSPNTPIVTRNVLGLLPANSPTPVDSLILVVAHYDHQGAIGKSAFFPGANDNASGVAMIMDIAQHFASQRRSRDLLFVAFSGEEVGLLGSKEFVRSPPVNLSRISLVVNLDMVASAEDGIVVMGGVENVHEFDELSRIVRFVDEEEPTEPVHHIRARTTTAISDHYPFFEAGVKSLYIYTNKGTQPYHSVLDVPQTLEWDDYSFTKDVIIRFLEKQIRIDD